MLGLKSKPKSFRFIILIILLLGLFSIPKLSLAAPTVVIESCPSPVQNSITASGIIFGDGVVDACGLKTPCFPSRLIQYAVIEVEAKIDGNYWGVPTWGPITDAVDGDCLNGKKCQGTAWFGTFNSSNISDISGLADGTHTLRIRALSVGGWGSTTCKFTKDTTDPTCSIDYPDEWINYATFNVTLNGSDATSGLDYGKIQKDEKPVGGTWPGYSDWKTGITSFPYSPSFTGSHCKVYRFRGWVWDKAGNQSSVCSDPEVKIDLVNPTADIIYTGGTFCFSGPYPIGLALNESDDCSGPNTGKVQRKERTIGGPSWDSLSWIDTFNTIGNQVYNGQVGWEYRFRYQVQDNAGNWSDWDNPQLTVTIRDANTDPFCDNPPDVPTLLDPPNNQWINYNPYFEARLFDPDGNNVCAYFDIIGAPVGASGWSNSCGEACDPNACAPVGCVPSGGQVCWGPVNLGSCAQYWWHAHARDYPFELDGGWSGNWLVKVDKDPPPPPNISYDPGTISVTTFDVTLSGSDPCSGVVAGDVDVSTDGGATWTNSGLPNGGNTTSSFTYTGTDGQCYKFQYKVKDAANNWSGYASGGQVCIQLPPVCECSSSDGPCCSDNCNYDSSSIVCQAEAEVEYQCAGSACGDDYQERTKDRYCPGNAATCTGSLGSWSTWSTVEDCLDSQLCYTTSLYCRDEPACEPNNPPIAIPNSPYIPDYCASTPVAIILPWQFSDPDSGDTQSAFQVQITRVRDGQNYDSGKKLRSSTSFTAQEINTEMGGNFIWYDSTEQGYTWRMKVWDNNDVESLWANGPAFVPPKHSYPVCKFSHLPESPPVGEGTYFTDESTCYDDAPPAGGDCSKSEGNIDSFSWTFQDANPATSDIEDPVTTFSTTGTDKTVSFTVTDSSGYSCTITEDLDVKFPLPEWKEIKPW